MERSVTELHCVVTKRSEGWPRSSKNKDKGALAMNISKQKTTWKLAAAIYILMACLLSLSFLESFPFVHSDESWLAGLSRAMLEEKSIGVTEPFFDARPRYPHGIKALFHLMQMGMITLFGYGVRAARLLSWIGGADQ